MKLSMIVAVSENGVIGRAGGLPWRLSADLRRFKALTMGSTLIMGRKTWESIGKPLPGREILVISRRADYRVEAEGVRVGHSLGEALAQFGEGSKVFVAGGAQIYRLALPEVSTIYLTRVHTALQGDTCFPDPDPAVWQCVSRENFEADDRNAFDYSFLLYTRRDQTSGSTRSTGVSGS